MFVKKIKVTNFKGVNHFEHEFSPNKPTLLVGKNGAGKTSVIQALKYGLTGVAPSNPINSSAIETSVMMDITDLSGKIEDFNMERIIKKPSKSSVIIMGKTANITSGNDWIEDTFGINTKELNTVLSSELLADTKPAALGEFLLKHDKRKISVEDIEKIMLDDGSKARLDISGSDPSKLPPDLEAMFHSFVKTKDVSLEGLATIAEKAKAERSELKALYTEYKSRSKDFKHIVKPTYDEAELNEKLNEIIAVEKNVETAKKLRAQYDLAKKNKKKQDTLLSELELQKMALGKPKKPDEENYKKITDEIKSAEKMNISLTNLIARIESTTSLLDKMEDDLKHSVCPLNNKLSCKEDREGLMEKIEKEKEENVKEMIKAKDELKVIAEKLENLNMEKNSFEENRKRFERLVLINEQIKNIEDNPIEIPEAPPVIVKTSYEAEKKDIQDALKAIRLFNECEEDFKKSIIYKRQADIADYIYKSCDDGGIVKTAFIKASVSFLELLCNEHAYIFDPDMHVQFIVDGGLKVFFNLKGVKLPYENLSTGEKITAIFMLMDLVNRYLNSETLILDELNDLDEVNFEKLLVFLTNPDINSSYANIILSCVNNKGLMEVAEKYDEKIDIVEL